MIADVPPGQGEQLDQVRAAMATLSDQQRLVLLCKTCDEMTFQRIADELEISVSTAQDALHQGVAGDAGAAGAADDGGSLMNDREFELKLADYLAGELDANALREFEALLAGDPARRRMADELGAALGAVRAAVPGPELAEQRTRGLSLAGERSGAADAPAWRILSALTRYAAVILLAFTFGFLARGWQGESAAVGSEQVVVAAEPSYTMQFAERYAQVAHANPGASSFGRTLLAIARR